MFLWITKESLQWWTLKELCMKMKLPITGYDFTGLESDSASTVLRRMFYNDHELGALVLRMLQNTCENADCTKSSLLQFDWAQTNFALHSPHDPLPLWKLCPYLHFSAPRVHVLIVLIIFLCLADILFCFHSVTTFYHSFLAILCLTMFSSMAMCHTSSTRWSCFKTKMVSPPSIQLLLYK